MAYDCIFKFVIWKVSIWRSFETMGVSFDFRVCLLHFCMLRTS